MNKHLFVEDDIMAREEIEIKLIEHLALIRLELYNLNNIMKDIRTCLEK